MTATTIRLSRGPEQGDSSIAASKRKAGFLRRLFRFVLALALVAGLAVLALELAGHPIRPMLQTYNLEREARAIGRRSDEEFRRTTNVAARQIGGTALAQAIRLSRNHSLAEGTDPVPEDIRTLLEPHFPSLDFDKVRWKPSTASFGLGSVLTRWYLTEGAVVLEDVVVFSSVRGITDVRLWAHELTHVVQYRELGVDGFARAYVLGHAEIERQAEDHALDIMDMLDMDEAP